MSYTLTLDVPKKTVAYIERTPSLNRMLKEIVMACVSAELRKEEARNVALDETPGPRLLASFREAEEMEQGLRPRQDFKTVDELFADCLA